MTPSNIYTDLAAGKSSRELDAAICVLCQYVPGAPEARNVNLWPERPNLIFFNTASGAQIYGVVPPLTTSLDAVVAMERAKGGFGQPYREYSIKQGGDGEWCASIRRDDYVIFFRAPTEIHARLGALCKLMEAGK